MRTPSAQERQLSFRCLLVLAAGTGSRSWRDELDALWHELLTWRQQQEENADERTTSDEHQ